MSKKSAAFQVSGTAPVLLLDNPAVSGVSKVIRSCLLRSFSPFPAQFFIRRGGVDYTFGIGTYKSDALHNIVDKSVVLEPGDALWVQPNDLGVLLNPSYNLIGASTASASIMVNWLETTDLNWKLFLDKQLTGNVVFPLLSNPSILESLYVWKPYDGISSLNSYFQITRATEPLHPAGFDGRYPVCPFDAATPYDSLIFTSTTEIHVVASTYRVDISTTSQYFATASKTSPGTGGGTGINSLFSVPTGFSGNLHFASFSRSANTPASPAKLFILTALGGIIPVLYDSSWDYSGTPNRFANLIQSPIHIAADESLVLNYTNDGGSDITIFYAYTLVPDL